MNAPPRVLSGFRLAALAAGALWCAGAAWAPVPAARAEGDPLLLGAPFGEHDGLQLAVDNAGASALAWRTSSGEGQTIGFAEIPAGAREASGVETVVSVAHRRLSSPVLAISPAGRVLVAWYEQRGTAQEWSEDVLSLKTRERSAARRLGSDPDAWRAPRKSADGPGSLAAALDDRGDAAVMWTIERERVADPDPLRLLVATRPGTGAYTPAFALDSTAAEAEPAIALTPGGEVTALWEGPWRAPNANLYDQSWHAGSAPSAGPAVLDSIASTSSHGVSEPFRRITLQTSPSGEELAVWLKGQSGETGRPYLVPLRAAWRSPRAAFETPQTVRLAGGGSTRTRAGALERRGRHSWPGVKSTPRAKDRS